LPEKAEGFTKRSSAVLRCKPYRSTYVNIRLAVRFLRALHLNIFEQPQKTSEFMKPLPNQCLQDTKFYAGSILQIEPELLYAARK